MLTRSEIYKIVCLIPSEEWQEFIKTVHYKYDISDDYTTWSQTLAESPDIKDISTALLKLKLRYS
jgi:hypothetical protein